MVMTAADFVNVHYLILITGNIDSCLLAIAVLEETLATMAKIVFLRIFKG